MDIRYVFVHKHHDYPCYLKQTVFNVGDYHPIYKQDDSEFSANVQLVMVCTIIYLKYHYKVVARIIINKNFIVMPPR